MLTFGVPGSTRGCDARSNIQSDWGNHQSEAEEIGIEAGKPGERTENFTRLPREHRNGAPEHAGPSALCFCKSPKTKPGGSPAPRAGPSSKRCADGIAAAGEPERTAEGTGREIFFPSSVNPRK